jgi:hypothetical protein
MDGLRIEAIVKELSILEDSRAILIDIAAVYHVHVIELLIGAAICGEVMAAVEVVRERREVGGAGCERLQVRCAGFNGKLGSSFGQLFQAVDPASELTMVA